MTIETNIFKIKFACVTNDNAKTSIKNHIYHYATLHEMIICDRQPHIAPIGAIQIFQ
jgi:hypothetical protein